LWQSWHCPCRASNINGSTTQDQQEVRFWKASLALSAEMSGRYKGRRTYRTPSDGTRHADLGLITLFQQGFKDRQALA
jgi:hypothetical protein